MAQGTVKFFSDDKGFGFIMPTGRQRASPLGPAPSSFERARSGGPSLVLAEIAHRP